jgi:hypothetical protein
MTNDEVFSGTPFLLPGREPFHSQRVVATEVGRPLERHSSIRHSSFVIHAAAQKWRARDTGLS